MGLIGKILSIFGGGSSAADPAQPSEPAEPAEPAEPEPDAEAKEGEPEEEEAESEDDGMSTKAVAEMADPRRREDEENTVHNRAENPADHADAEGEEAESEVEENESEAEDDDGMSTKAVAEMADPRRREDEENTVHNRAENPDDQRAT